jgi:hypothetical protein
MPLAPEERARLEARLAQLQSEKAAYLASQGKGAEDVSLSFKPATPPAAAAPRSELLDGVDLVPTTSVKDAAALTPPEDPNMTARIKSAVYPTTAEEGVNPAHEKLPDWIRLPELRNVSGASALALVGTANAGPEEAKQIIEAQFPGVTAKVDGRYVIFKSKEDGQEYAWKPGMRLSDVGRGLAGAAIAAPATYLAPAGVVGGVLAGAGGAALNEAAQALAGGTFDLAPIGIGGVAGAALPAASRAKEIAHRAIAGEAPAAAQTAEELAGAISRTAQGDSAAAATLARSAAPDAEALAAAKANGLAGVLGPEHVTESDAVRQAMQGAKAVIPALKQQEQDAIARFLGVVRQKFADWGAQSEQGVFSERVREGLATASKNFQQRVKDAYAAVKLPPTEAPVVSSTIQTLEQRAAEHGGAQYLSTYEQKLLKDLTESPTIARFKTIRSEWGAATKGKGPYAPAEPGLAKMLFKQIEADYLATAEKYGQKEALEAASSLASEGFKLQKETAATFGKKAAETLAGTKMQGAVGQAVKGDATKLATAMRLLPQEMQGEAAISGLFHALAANGDGTLSLAALDGLARQLKANPQAAAVLFHHIPAEAREGLPQLLKLARGITKAAEASKSDFAGAVRGAQAADGFIASIIKPLAKVAAPALDIAGLPATFTAAPFTGRLQGVGRLLVEKVTGSNVDKMNLVTQALTSADGVTMLEAIAARAPQGRIEALASKLADRSPSFARLMNAAKIPPAERRQWIMQAVASSAAQQANNVRKETE